MRIFAPFLLCFSFAHLAPAQDTRGTISGTVTDSQAAVIAGATVIVANTGTGTSTRLTTNANGYFEASLLLPGSYSITVETSGFKRSVRSGLALQLRGDAINVYNRSQMGAPELSPTSTNFGRITSQTSSLNRFYQIQARIQF